MRPKDTTEMTAEMTGEVRRGDLRLITPGQQTTEGPRLGVVLRTDPTLPFTEIALVHPYTELATSLDGVVPGALAGTPYDVVVQSDLRGIVWTHAQVARRVGRLSEPTLNTISDLVAASRPESPTGIRIGTRLAGPHDRRWPFKAEEGNALDLLTADCTTALLDEPLPG